MALDVYQITLRSLINFNIPQYISNQFNKRKGGMYSARTSAWNSNDGSNKKQKVENS